LYLHSLHMACRPGVWLCRRKSTCQQKGSTQKFIDAVKHKCITNSFRNVFYAANTRIYLHTNNNDLWLHVYLLLQSALQPSWVLTCTTIVEYSQQEGFYRVPLPATCQTPNMEDQWLERSNSHHRESPVSEMTQANSSSGRWNYEREIAENFAESGDFHVTFAFSFTCRKFTTWDRRLYFTSEGWRAEDFFVRKNPTASAGFKPADLGTKGQHDHL